MMTLQQKRETWSQTESARVNALVESLPDDIKMLLVLGAAKMKELEEEQTEAAKYVGFYL